MNRSRINRTLVRVCAAGWMVGWMVAALVVAAAGTSLGSNAPAATGTFSIVAYDSLTGELGVAVESRAFSVGSSVAWVEAGVGAIATQATTNQSFGPRGLELLRQGRTSAEVLELLLASDEGKENRQVGIVDASGRPVNFTGSQCLAWAGGRTGRSYACQGNILVSEQVIDAMARAFEGTAGELADRMLAALVAAQAAGGDKRGKQSAALLVVRPSGQNPEYRYRYIDLRVEDSPDPISELIRLYGIQQKTRLLQAHLRYAEAYDKEGRPDLAVREKSVVGSMLTKALADSVKDSEYLNNLAWFCATSDLYLPEAVEAARRAVALAPDNAGILDTLAEAYFRSGQADKAIETIQAAIKLDPESAYYREQLKRFQK